MANVYRMANIYRITLIEPDMPSPLSLKDWLDIQLKRQEKIKKWCVMTMGYSGYPRWQFTDGADYSIDNMLYLVYFGLFIFQEEDRVAFKLKAM